MPETHLHRLIAHFSEPVREPRGVLGGRGTIAVAEVPGVGPVVVKRYRRGGLLRFLTSDRYFRFGPTRAEVEFHLLNRARALGVNAPEPIAFASEGRYLYRCWLVTQEIKAHQTLAEISLADEERTPEIMPRVVEQVCKLVENNLLHYDLHPGNVLIDSEGTVFLVDFDKSHFFKGTKNELRDRYLKRWRRACIKHNMPEILSELMGAGLRRNFVER